tara:strand:+ start:250 stop:1428 length:1179 start_codon:yes stop_codon:yes gene_type:complete
MKKNISILGATGSVGLNTLKIIDAKKKDFKIILLSANKNYKLICKQIKKYKPKYYIINNYFIFKLVEKKFKNKKIEILNNFNFNFRRKKIDFVISAIPGIAGLHPTLLMIKSCKTILIANKEAIICGWSLIKNTAKKNKTKIIPVDSEHYSIFKMIQNHKISSIKKIFLTASGGPFLNLEKNKFKNIRPKDALRHPKWKMGKKISVDSSTLMNKIFELVEAQKLFNLPKNKIDILIHPNSLVHAIVEFKNGLTQFLYHETSMIIPIANAIYDGNLNIAEYLKKDNVSFEKNKIENLVFKKVDKKIFPSISLKSKINQYPSSPIIINAANEVLVDNFLRQKIPFLRIFEIIKTIMNDRNYKKYAVKKPIKIYQIKLIDSWARSITVNKIKLKR